MDVGVGEPKMGIDPAVPPCQLAAETEFLGAGGSF